MMMIKALIWNIRSVNTQQDFPRVINMNRKHNFCVVALMEPFQKKGLIDRYRRRLNMETAYANINGQIWLFFDALVEWELVEDTEQHVTVRVFHHDLGQHMMITFVYAKCLAIERLEFLDHLYYLASVMELPWLVGGDFNMVLHEDEKIGGLTLYPPEYEDFAFCVNSCGLFEQGYKGSPFTWWNGRSKAECLFKRLDRIFVNLPFQNMLPTIEVEHLIRTGSDHATLLMTCGVQTTNFVKPFRFLNFGTKHATFMDVVRQNWEVDFIGDPFLMFKQNIKRVKAALSKCSRETFGDIFKQLAILEDIVRVKEIKKLQLKRIKNGSGVWIEDQEQLAIAAVDFYQKQFTNEGDASEFSLLNNVPSMSSGLFKSTRGVKQRDPLSPALFILSAEAVGAITEFARGTSEFHSFSELPSVGERLINLDKSQSPNLRVRIAKRRTPD
ncbi:uncharacterized protein [Nicotiana tomentosiformis]|uniref:uncharacterized protein n=1 Tax=Nicotiana tomentosiformis TaxID=4098 RepID=UPI00388C940B